MMPTANESSSHIGGNIHSRRRLHMRGSVIASNVDEIPHWRLFTSYVVPGARRPQALHLYPYKQLRNASEHGREAMQILIASSRELKKYPDTEFVGEVTIITSTPDTHSRNKMQMMSTAGTRKSSRPTARSRHRRRNHQLERAGPGTP